MVLPRRLGWIAQACLVAAAFASRLAMQVLTLLRSQITENSRRSAEERRPKASPPSRIAPRPCANLEGILCNMSSSLTRTVRPGITAGILILTVCGGLLSQAAAAAPCAPAATAKADILGVMDDLFAALRADDQERFQKITAPDFYAYDGGMRLAGSALMDVIKKGHASGMRWEWSVTDPEVHVTCNLAWITYVNQGSVETSSGRQAQTWLESAILEYSGARWRIRFAHSTRVPKQS